MSHSVSETAARAVKNSERKNVATRTPEEMFRDIRSNLAAHLFVTPTHIQFLLAQYDGVVAENKILHENVRLSAEFMTTSNDTISKLIEQVEQLREVYDEEHSNKGTVTVEAIGQSSEGGVGDPSVVIPGPNIQG